MTCSLSNLGREKPAWVPLGGLKFLQMIIGADNIFVYASNHLTIRV